MAKADQQSKATDDKDTSKEGAGGTGAAPDEPSKARNAELESAKAELAASKARNAELESNLADEREKNEKMLATAPSLRKAFAKPTGRHVPKSHYRTTVDTKEKAAALAKQGLPVVPFYDPANPKSILMYTVTIPAPPEKGDPPAYVLPEEIIEHGVKCGALEPELR